MLRPRKKRVKKKTKKERRPRRRKSKMTMEKNTGATIDIRLDDSDGKRERRVRVQSHALRICPKGKHAYLSLPWKVIEEVATKEGAKKRK